MFWHIIVFGLLRTKDEGDYHEKTILFFLCRPTGCIIVGCDVNLVQCFDIFRKHRIYYRAILESLTGRVDNIQQSETRKGPLLWQQVMHSLTKIRIRRLQIHRDVQMNRCIRIRWKSRDRRKSGILWRMVTDVKTWVAVFLSFMIQ